MCIRDSQQVKHCHQLPVGVQEDNQWISGKAGKRAGPDGHIDSRNHGGKDASGENGRKESGPF